MNFFDSNVLIYSQSNDPKRAVAMETVSLGGVISVQVLNEFIHVLRRKSKRHWHDVLEALVDFDAAFPPPLPLTLADHREAVRLSRDHQLSIYDAMIVAVALRAGCERLFTEDLQHGQRFGTLEIVNPFV
jgi:predicted nucleic acid-binding protein